MNYVHAKREGDLLLGIDDKGRLHIQIRIPSKPKPLKKWSDYKRPY